MRKFRKYWNEKYECADSDIMRTLQLSFLRDAVYRVQRDVPFYSKKFYEAGVNFESINSLEDLAKFPFTVKTDLRDNYPFGLCAVSMEKIVRIHASSGTTGKPITGPYTKKDMRQWAECMARTFWAAGIRPNDRAQNALGMGLFTGGLGFLLGAERVGFAVIPSGSGMTERQIMLIQDFMPTVLFATPSYALTIVDKAEETGIDLSKFSLKTGVFGAEPWSDALREEIEKKLGIAAHEAYGLTEMMGPGVAFSCEYKNLHINEDHIYPEIIDPTTLEVLPLGEEGELVLTAFQREAMPLIRYRTRDITTLRRVDCLCGRTLIVMDRVTRRSDDMKKINGVIMYPSQIESILLRFQALAPFYQITIRKKNRLDAVTVEVELETGALHDAEKKGVLEGKISEKIKDIIGITCRVVVLPPGLLPRSEGKAKRLIDERGEQ